LADDIEGDNEPSVEQAADEALDGGIGSGNFNHAGRIGFVGGSSENGANTQKDVYSPQNKYYNVKDTVESYRGKPDGTYDILTGENKANKYTEGYFVSFHQNEPDENGHYKSHYGRYTSEQYDKQTNVWADRYGLEVNIGCYDNEPEVSFWTKDKQLAKRLAKAYNQKAIWDIEAMDEIPNPHYDKTKNPMQGD
jgi:hypothetical protein